MLRVKGSVLNRGQVEEGRYFRWVYQKGNAILGTPDRDALEPDDGSVTSEPDAAWIKVGCATNENPLFQEAVATVDSWFGKRKLDKNANEKRVTTLRTARVFSHLFLAHGGMVVEEDELDDTVTIDWLTVKNGKICVVLRDVNWRQILADTREGRELLLIACSKYRDEIYAAIQAKDSFYDEADPGNSSDSSNGNTSSTEDEKPKHKPKRTS